MVSTDDLIKMVNLYPKKGCNIYSNAPLKPISEPQINSPVCNCDLRKTLQN
jgi:hypothetical protein